MTHTIRDKAKLLARVRRIRGQVEAVERALAEEAGCETVMHQIAGIRGAVSGLMAEVVEAHVRAHFGNGAEVSAEDGEDAAEQLIGAVRTYLR